MAIKRTALMHHPNVGWYIYLSEGKSVYFYGRCDNPLTYQHPDLDGMLDRAEGMTLPSNPNIKEPEEMCQEKYDNFTRLYWDDDGHWVAAMPNTTEDREIICLATRLELKAVMAVMAAERYPIKLNDTVKAFLRKEIGYGDLRAAVK